MLPSSPAAARCVRQRAQETCFLRHNSYHIPSVGPAAGRRLSVVAALRDFSADGKPRSSQQTGRNGPLARLVSTVEQGLSQLSTLIWSGAELRLLLQVGQVAASLAFVVLYIWSTYEPVVRGSWRHTADLALSAVFAADLVARIRSAGASWPRMLLSPLSLLDMLSFAPGVMELCGASWLGAGLQGVGVDLRWFRIFRALRLLRLCLLTGNLPLMKLSRSALLSGAVNVRLMQLVASVLALLFTSASLVHAVERLPWHDALYFVTTTLTTVGYGDVVVKTLAGRLIVVVFMAVGVVLIPVRTGQLWGQLASRRLTAGTLRPGKPVVLLSTRLSEVRGFADLTEEFFHQVQLQRFIPRDVHLMVLGNKPSYEFTAFQELHDHRMTLVEGSVLSAADLVRCRAEAAAAVLVLGDRFATDAAAEDLDVLFRVWAIKSYTKCVPLTVQVLRASALAKVTPFLDPHQDVIMSVEQMRHRLLALSALCPGASTLLGNLLHTAGPSEELRDSVFRPPGAPAPKLAGRSWFAEYTRGCGHDLHVVPVRSPLSACAAAAAAAAGFVRPPSGSGPAAVRNETDRRAGGSSRVGVPSSLAGCSFGSVVSAAFQKKHLLVIGILSGDGFGRVSLNPPHYRRLLLSDQLVLIAHSEAQATSLRDPEVIQAAYEATKAADAAAAAAATAAAEAATADAAAAAARAREVAAAGAAAAFGGGSGGSGSESSETEGADVAVQRATDAATAAAVTAAASGGSGRKSLDRKNRNGGGGGGKGGSGARVAHRTNGSGSRVKRYFPSLASWDEELPDYFTEKEGSFFAGQRESVRQGSAGAGRTDMGDSGSGGGTSGAAGAAEVSGRRGDGEDLDEQASWLVEVPARVAAGEGWMRPGPPPPAVARSLRQAHGTKGEGDEPSSSSSSSYNCVEEYEDCSVWVDEPAPAVHSHGAKSEGAVSSASGKGSVISSLHGSSNSTTTSSNNANGHNGHGNSHAPVVPSSLAIAAVAGPPPPPFATLLSPSLDEPGGLLTSSTEADIGAMNSTARHNHHQNGSTTVSSTTGGARLLYSGPPSSSSSSSASAPPRTTSPAAAAHGTAATAATNPPTTNPTANSPASGTTIGTAAGSGGGGVGIPAASASAPLAPSAAFVSAATSGALQAVGHNPPAGPSGSSPGRPYALVDAPWRQSEPPGSTRRGHIILAGAIDSFVEFARVLHRCAGMRDPESGASALEVVVLHPNPPEATVLSLGAMGPTRVVRGSPADPRALEQAGTARARCLVYLGHSERPAGPRGPSDPGSSDASPPNADYGTTSQAGVQADAEALLTCYGVGEEAIGPVTDASTDGYGSGGDDDPAVRRSPMPPVPPAVSASMTPVAAAAAAAASSPAGGRSGAPTGPQQQQQHLRRTAGGVAASGPSGEGNAGGGGEDARSGGGGDGDGTFYNGAVRGHSVVELSFTSSVRFLQPGLLLQGTSVWDESCSIGGPSASPRRSWRQRREAEVAAVQQGLVQWQTNIYYGAGRVVVPALVDTFTIQAFAKRNLLLDVMSELCGDDGRPHGTPLRLLPVPKEMAGRPYRELFESVVAHGSISLGLYRSKSENPAWRLHFVSTNPAWEDVLSADDKVFVLRAADVEGAGEP